MIIQIIGLFVRVNSWEIVLSLVSLPLGQAVTHIYLFRTPPAAVMIPHLLFMRISIYIHRYIYTVWRRIGPSYNLTKLVEFIMKIVI